MNIVSAKSGNLEKRRYAPTAHFLLPESCCLHEYSQPMQAIFGDSPSRNVHGQETRALVEIEQMEINLNEKCKAFIGYRRYKARKIA